MFWCSVNCIVLCALWNRIENIEKISAFNLLRYIDHLFVKIVDTHALNEI